jgi:hypothetical protein
VRQLTDFWIPMLMTNILLDCAVLAVYAYDPVRAWGW